MFYTALYHALLHPNLVSDVNGEYPLMERSGETGVTDGERYTVFSLWDTCRNLHRLLTLVYPDRQREMLRSMTGMYEEWGWLPKWELYGRETFTMEGDPAIPVIVDSWMKGLRDFDVAKAYEAMRKSATTPGAQNRMRPDLDPYIEKGYIPLGFYAKDLAGDTSVSHALEYYMADAALSLLADSLGQGDDARLFRARSLGYKRYYSPESGTLRPLHPDGTFLSPFDPKAGENFTAAPGFHEGSAWNYTFYVPHDVEGLAKLMGGRRKFIDKLQMVFDEGLVRPCERTRHRLCVSVQPLPGRGVAHAAGNPAAVGAILYHRPRRHPGQRRHGDDVGVGCLHDAGPLSRLPGRAVLHADVPDIRPGRNRHGAGNAGDRKTRRGLYRPDDAGR